MLRTCAPGGMRADGRELAAVFAGGVAGALCRAGLDDALAVNPPAWPWATFAVNLAGAFLLGCVTTRLQGRRPPSAYWRPLLGTGFCGALTTFSAMQLELLRMLDADHLGRALGYAAASVVAGFLAVALGTGLVRRGRTLA